MKEDWKLNITKAILMVLIPIYYGVTLIKDRLYERKRIKAKMKKLRKQDDFNYPMY